MEKKNGRWIVRLRNARLPHVRDDDGERTPIELKEGGGVEKY